MTEQFIKLIETAKNFGAVTSACLYKYDGCCTCCSVSGEMENGTEFTLRLDIKEAKEND